jgi:Zn ribbon nucleic-acid-binding protein
MECPKCKAKVGIMKHMLMVNTGAVNCIKCYICGYWVQTELPPASVGLECRPALYQSNNTGTKNKLHVGLCHS